MSGFLKVTTIHSKKLLNGNKIVLKEANKLNN